MRHKYNPWLSMVALLLLAVILVLVCTGCHDVTEEEELRRFTYEYAGSSPSTHGSFYIITDTWTGVQYLTNGNGLTKLEE